MDVSITALNKKEASPKSDAESTAVRQRLDVLITGVVMAEKNCKFVIHGKVVGKGRPHFVRKTGVALTPQATRSYESIIRDNAYREMNGDEPWTAPVVAKVVAYYEIPKSWTKLKKEMASKQLIAPSKPDVDNIVKIVLDACNRTVYQDDTQVVLCVAQKLWGEKARLEVEFTEA
jgi:Holliday junction resolvase RusA-like endonuclease